MDFKEFLNIQIENNKINWESRSALIRAAGQSVNGHTNRILKNYENNFNFAKILKIKNKEIKKYFSNLPKDSFINVVGAVESINKNLPKDINISETIIYNRLKDTKFNKNNLKPQTLDNQVSKFAEYDVDISKNFLQQLENLKQPGVYIRIEETNRGSKTIRLKLREIDKSFPPNQNSIKMIKEIINGKKK
tara:strand:- start:1109 stop:1681 length:573 start_codon:yes stop_codon:yes gene_type:complete